MSALLCCLLATILGVTAGYSISGSV